MKPQPRSNEAAGRHTPCVYTVVRKVARYETQASFKGRLVTYVADIRIMSALTPKSRHRSARGACPLCWSLASKDKRPCRGKTRRLLSQHSGRVAPDERDGSPLWCSATVG